MCVFYKCCKCSAASGNQSINQSIKSKQSKQSRAHAMSCLNHVCSREVGKSATNAYSSVFVSLFSVPRDEPAAAAGDLPSSSTLDDFAARVPSASFWSDARRRKPRRVGDDGDASPVAIEPVVAFSVAFAFVVVGGVCLSIECTSRARCVTFARGAAVRPKLGDGITRSIDPRNLDNARLECVSCPCVADASPVVGGARALDLKFVVVFLGSSPSGASGGAAVAIGTACAGCSRCVCCCRRAPATCTRRLNKF